jgi:hypothetical protein
MALLWSSLASGRAPLMTHVLSSMPQVPPGAGWVTYVRRHDDIGWAITEEDAAAVGEDAHLHRRFLSDFYAGDFPGSFARGARFQQQASSGEARTSGMAASLAGIEAALRSRAPARAGQPHRGRPAGPPGDRGRVRPGARRGSRRRAPTGATCASTASTSSSRPISSPGLPREEPIAPARRG